MVPKWITEVMQDIEVVAEANGYTELSKSIRRSVIPAIQRDISSSSGVNSSSGDDQARSNVIAFPTRIYLGR